MVKDSKSETTQVSEDLKEVMTALDKPSDSIQMRIQGNPIRDRMVTPREAPGAMRLEITQMRTVPHRRAVKCGTESIVCNRGSR